MAKTELTLSIEEALKTYKRGEGYSYIWHLPEVQISSAFNKRFYEVYHSCENPYRFSWRGQVDVVRVECKYGNKDWINFTGGGVENREYVYNLEITCFEIKISLSDFKSKNGHNFIGDYNYYVVPKDLYPKIKDIIPNGIGCITYDNGRLRQVKQSDKNDNWYLDRNRFIWNCITRQAIETNKLENRIKYLEVKLRESCQNH